MTWITDHVFDHRVYCDDEGKLRYAELPAIKAVRLKLARQRIVGALKKRTKSVVG